MSDQKTSMLLIRHGQSTWNEERRWQGQADPPLSANGTMQAFRAAKSVGSVDAIVSSPLSRALETAVIISESIGVGPVNLEEEIIERDTGDWSGLTREEIYTRWPNWHETGYRPKGWEDDDVFVERVKKGILNIASNFQGATILVVAHSGVILNLEREYGLDDQGIPNLSGRNLEVVGEKITFGERIDLLPEELRTGGTVAK